MTIHAHSWTALFRAFSSHQQALAYLTKGIPQLDKTLGLTDIKLVRSRQFSQAAVSKGIFAAC